MNRELKKKVALYLRVSTKTQHTSNQLTELKEVCDRFDYEIVDIYDETVSGTKNNEDRSEFSRLIKDVKRKRFDMVLVWSLDRLGRQTSELLKFLTIIEDYDVGLYCWKQGINTSDAMGRMFFQFVSVMSEYENSIRKERQLVGIERLKSQGKKYGGNDFISDDVKETVIQLKEEGLSYRKIKEQVDISLSSISSIVNA
ncbi:recombinase family protein [Gammaproteobacteria bacterium]|nr:recombinase family protein [Gammaproteobacteria bacterium]